MIITNKTHQKEMAHFSLATVVLALATLQVAFATIHYCNRPYSPSYGSYWPYKSKYPVGDTVYFSCKGGYGAYGSSSAKCLYNWWNKKAYWSHKPPVCKCKLSRLLRRLLALQCNIRFVTNIHFCYKSEVTGLTKTNMEPLTRVLHQAIIIDVVLCIFTRYKKVPQS